MKRKNLDDAVSEIRQLAEDFKKRNGNSSLRIPNKDFNLWLVNEMLELKGRVNIMQLKIWIFAIVIGLIGVNQIL